MDLPPEVLPLLPPIKPPGQVADLKTFQVNASNKLIYLSAKCGHRSTQLIGGTGVGKTYVGGSFLLRMKAAGLTRGPHNPFAPYPFWWITTANNVVSVKRELEASFGLKNLKDFYCTNYDQLRSREGSMFFSQEMEVVGGEERMSFKIKEALIPTVIIWDESHKLKNVDTLQSRLAQAINLLPLAQRPWQIFMSATPWTRVIDAKCFVTAGEIPILGIPTTMETWDALASDISTNGDPRLHSPTAVDTLREICEDYIVRIPAITGKYKAKNRCLLVGFDSPESRKRYDQAWERYQKRLQELGKAGPVGHFQQLVALGQFRQAAEIERSEAFARMAVEQDARENKSIVIAACYRRTIARTVRSMILDHGIPREDISLIWGGDDSQEAGKRMTEDERSKVVKQLMESYQGLCAPPKKSQMLKLERELLTTADDLADIEALKHINVNLGAQSREERQKEIDRFQVGRTRFCLFTQASGGTGISLHHTNQWFKTFYKDKFVCQNPDDEEEVQRWWLIKKSGVAKEVTYRSRPRHMFVTPTYSAQDFVQTLGRPHRSMFSLSDTYSDIVWFKDTVEEEVMAAVQNKLQCLSKVIAARESWHDILLEARTEAPTVVGQQVSEQFIEADDDLNESDSQDEEDDSE